MKTPKLPKPEARELWGVVWTAPSGYSVLVDSLLESDCQKRRYYPGEPPRKLLFCTRAQARAWIATHWEKANLRPVRVTETVRVAK